MYEQAKQNINKDQEPILKLVNCRQYFASGLGKRKVVVKAVHNVSFDIFKGEVFGLVGESGCGKTTTGRSIIKLYDITDGEILFKGQRISVGLRTLIRNIKYSKKASRTFNNVCNDYFKNNKRNFSFANYGVEDIEKAISDFPLQEKIKNSRSQIGELEKKIFPLKEEIINLRRQRNVLKNDTVDKINQRIAKINAKLILLEENKKRAITKQEKNVQVYLNKFEQTIKNYEQKIVLEQNEINKIESNVNTNDSQSIEKINRHKDRIMDYTVLIANTKNKKNNYENAIKPSDHYQKKIELEMKNLDIENENINILSIGNLEAIIAKLTEKEQQLLKLLEDVKALKYPEFTPIINDGKIRLKAAKKDNRRKPELMSKMQMIFQDPIDSLNPRMTVREIIAEGMIINKNIDISYIKNIQDIVFEEAKALNNLKREYNKAIQNNYQDQKAELHDKLKVHLDKIKNLKINSLSNEMKRILNINATTLSETIIDQDDKIKEIVKNGFKVSHHKYIDDKVKEVLRRVGLVEEHASRYPHEFSGGQRQRIGIARALVTSPELIIADEPVSALDVSIQAQVINLLNEIRNDLNLTILFIAHNLSVVKYFCDRIGVMYFGRLVELAPTEELFKHPMHPYTRALLSAAPLPDPEHERLRQRLTYNPRLREHTKDKPKLIEITPGHFVYGSKDEIDTYRRELNGEEIKIPTLVPLEKKDLNIEPEDVDEFSDDAE